MQDEAFEGQLFRPRNYTHNFWRHTLCADIDSDGFVQKSIGVRCLNHPVILTGSPEQCWQLKVQGTVKKNFKVFACFEFKIYFV